MTFDDEFTAALRRDLQSAHVGFDAAGAEDMIRVATQADPVGERRSYAAPLAAAAAVVVIGGGVATFAATRGDGSPTGGGPVGPLPCATTATSAVASLVPPPIYSGPASAEPSVITTSVPPLPTATPTPTVTPFYTGEPTPSTSIAPSTSAAVPPPPEATVTVTDAPSSVLPAPTVTATDLPTPVPSTSPTDEPCATGTANASEAPSALPTAATRVAPTGVPDCSTDMIDPGFSGCITFRVRSTTQPGATSSEPVVNVNAGPVPTGARYRVASYQIDNPGADSAMVVIRQAGRTFSTDRVTPSSSMIKSMGIGATIEVSRTEPATVEVTCESTDTVCTTTVLIAASIDPLSVTSTGTATVATSPPPPGPVPTTSPAHS